MGSLRLLVPDETTNYIANPAPRYGTTGWTAFGSSISRDLLMAKSTIASIKVVTNGAILGEGAYYRVNSLAGVVDILTASIYVIGTGIVRLRLIEGGSQWYTQRITLTGKWQRLSVTGRCSGSSDVRLYVETDQKAQGVTFYISGAQLERKAEATTYCDGDQDGCRWLGVAYASSSLRSAYTREGGRWVTIAGPDSLEPDLYATEISGLGMAPIDNNIQKYTMNPGSFHQNVKVSDRVITLTYNVKNAQKYGRRCDPNDLSRLHQLRNMLMEIVRPDLTAGDQEFILEYQNGDYPIYFKARYDSGLEGDWDLRNSFVNSFPLRLLAVSPFAWEDDRQVANMNFVSDLGVLKNVCGRINGAWSNLNFGLNSTVYGIKVGPDGKVYAFGDFLFANNSVSAIAPNIPAGGVAYWDGTQWNALGTGAISGGGVIYDLAVAPNGYVYVVGSFTSIGGVAANRVAYWNGTAWNAMGTGLNDVGRAVDIAPNGKIYVGGDFTTAGGNPAYRLARYDGTWVALGTYGGLNASVRALDVSPDGTLIYIGGSFTDEQTNPLSGLNYACLYTVSTNLFSALSTGMNNTVNSLAIAGDGKVYFAGAFTTAGGATVNYAAYWDNASWKSMGASLNNTARRVSIAPDQTILFGGDFTIAGGLEARFVAIWNGSVWKPIDVSLAIGASPSVYGFAANPKGDLFIGGSGFSTGSKATRASATTTISNTGTAEVHPALYILGPGNLRWLENQSTHKVIQFSLDIQPSEEVFIDFARGLIQSTVRGDLSYAVLESSEFRAFSLRPGDNLIAALMLNDVSGYMQMAHIPRHWGADATKRGDSL